MMCVELWGAESGWMNFGEWTRRESGIAVRKGMEGICNMSDVECAMVHIVLVG